VQQGPGAIKQNVWQVLDYMLGSKEDRHSWEWKHTLRLNGPEWAL